MDIKINHVKIEKTVRLSTFGNLSPSTKYLWIALHGSRMLCDQVLYKFSDFNPDEHFVVAPEGYNKCYANGFSGEVVASWMTKRDRLHEIEDISNFLNLVLDQYSTKCAPDAKKIVMGFSQGGTMAYRWMHRSKVDIDALISYACWIPEDIDLSQSLTDLNEIVNVYTYGQNDEYITNDLMKEIESIIERNNLKIHVEAYQGNHRIERVQLNNLFEKYLKEK